MRDTYLQKPKYIFLTPEGNLHTQCIGKYNFMRKADTLLESLYRSAKVNRTLRVQELRYIKCGLYKKTNVYHKLERKGQSTMSSASSIRTKFQDLGS